MKYYTIYNSVGMILRTGICPEEDVLKQAGENEFVLEEKSDYKTQYIENQQIVDMPPKPNDNYVFNYQTKTWEADLVYADKQARKKRDLLLQQGPDRVNPFWYDSMTQTQKDAWATYRQDLLNVPEQSGYPLNIDWPVAPTN